MFALLALFGDMGCSTGPTVAGFVASSMGENLKKGVTASLIFPSLMVIMILIILKTEKKKKDSDT